MRRVLAVLTIPLLAGPALAQGRPSSLGMTCEGARAWLGTRGGAVLGTGGATYDRFVVDRRFCQPTEVTVRALVPTRDTPTCWVGYRCKEPSGSDRLNRF